MLAHVPSDSNLGLLMFVVLVVVPTVLFGPPLAGAVLGAWVPGGLGRLLFGFCGLLVGSAVSVGGAWLLVSWLRPHWSVVLLAPVASGPVAFAVSRLLVLAFTPRPHPPGKPPVPGDDLA